MIDALPAVEWGPRLYQEVAIDTHPVARGVVVGLLSGQKQAWVRIGREDPVRLPWCVLRPLELTP